MAKLTIINRERVVTQGCKTFIYQRYSNVDGTIKYLDCDGVERQVSTSRFKPAAVGVHTHAYFCGKEIISFDYTTRLGEHPIEPRVYDENGCNIPNEDKDDTIVVGPQDVDFEIEIEGYTPEKGSLSFGFVDPQQANGFLSDSNILNQLESVKIFVNYPNYNDLNISYELLPTILTTDPERLLPVSSMESYYAIKTDEQAREDFRFETIYGCVVAHVEAVTKAGKVIKSNYVTACPNRESIDKPPYIGSDMEDPERDWRDPYDEHMNDVDQGYDPDYDTDRDY